MSFLKSSTSFTRFILSEDVPDAFWGDFPEKLRQFAFKDIDELPEDRGWGWVCFEDMLDVEWGQFPPRKGGDYATFSLRLDTRRVPPAVIKKFLGLALKKEEAQNLQAGKKFISRERKKEIKELVLFQLKKRFLPIPAEFQVVWNISTGIVMLASTQGKIIELFQEYFIHSFELHLEQLTPYGLATCFLGDAELEKLDRLEVTSFNRS